MMKTFLKFCGFYVLLSFLSANAWAQFPGDVFFEAPSQRAEIGDQVEFNVQGFTGGEVFGAAAVEISFDTSKLEFVSTSSNVDATCTDEGVLSFAKINGNSLVSPLGTVDLATVTLKVIGGDGTISQLFVQANDYLLSDGTPLTVRRGLSGDVLIGNAGGGGGVSPIPLPQPVFRQSSSNSVVTTETENSELVSRARGMRRSGYPVTLNYFDNSGEVKTTTVFNNDLAVESE